VLYSAIVEESYEFIELLLNNIIYTKDTLSKVLQHAVETEVYCDRDNHKIYKLLLHHGADINYINVDSNYNGIDKNIPSNPIFLQPITTKQFLIDNGMNILYLKLARACYSDNIVKVKILLEKCFNTN